ncbi:hypothetical protein FRB99_003004 [Tulasnella sp. 403]|nr:hypothetical protein FRB99_003004 [Tulasnella sp. 403]
MDEEEVLRRVLEISRQEEEERRRRLEPIKNDNEVIEVVDSDEEYVQPRLGPQNHAANHRGTEEVNHDEEYQRDLERALALSMDYKPSTKRSLSNLPPHDKPTLQPHASDQPTTSQRGLAPGVSLFLAERAKLERERRARQKRIRPDIKQSSGEEDTDVENAPPAKRSRVNNAKPTTLQPVASSSSPKTFGPDTSTPSDEPLFWDGELRQTANRFALPSKDTKPVFRLTEILGHQAETVKRIKLIILASYANDVDFLLKILPENVPIILVGQPGEDGKSSVHNILPNWIKVTPFLPNGRGCMHMKFMLIFYSDGRLRVVITTANFIGYDWRDIENTAWVQDIPLRSHPIEHDPDADDFPSQFRYALSKLNVPPALVSHLRGDHAHLPLRSINELRSRWDWSRVKMQLVVSVAGKFEGKKQVLRAGHTGLGTAIKALGASLPDGKGLHLECQGSSIGTYSASWINEFYASAKGWSLDRWFDYKTSTGRGKLTYPSNVKILFPSLATVDHSALGREGGGTMFCRGLFVEKARSRPNVPKPSKSKDADADVGGWCYIGSHNFSASAWGNLSGSADHPVLNVSNYEMGILFTLPLENTEDMATDVACWERPPEKYRPNVDLPWMQEQWNANK